MRVWAIAPLILKYVRAAYIDTVAVADVSSNFHFLLLLKQSNAQQKPGTL